MIGDVGRARSRDYRRSGIFVCLPRLGVVTLIVNIRQAKLNLSKHRYVYVLLSVMLLAHLQVIRELMFDWWHDDNYSHGFLIVPLAIYFFYRERNNLVFPARTCKTGLAMFVLGFLLILLGTAAGEYFTTRIGLVTAVAGLAMYHLGARNFRFVWFSFFLLLFMIPIPSTIYYALTGPMQTFAARVTDSLLQLIGAPSVRQGNIISLGGYNLEVAEACSGLRSLVSLLTMAAVYGYLLLPGRAIPTLVFVAAIPIAIAANIFRIFVTAVGAYAFSPELADGFLHELSGILVFLMAILMIILLSKVLKWIAKRSK